MEKLRFAALLGFIFGTSFAHAAGDNVIRAKAPISPQPGSWVAAEPIIGRWLNTGPAYACGSWYPLEKTVSKGSWFVQKSSCSQNYERIVMLTETNQSLGITRETGQTLKETKTDLVFSTRTVLGTRNCDFDPSHTVWQIYRLPGADYLDMVWFSGLRIANASQFPAATKSLVYEGITYSRGDLVREIPRGDLSVWQYAVCRDT